MLARRDKAALSPGPHAEPTSCSPAGRLDTINSVSVLASKSWCQKPRKQVDSFAVGEEENWLPGICYSGRDERGISRPFQSWKQFTWADGGWPASWATQEFLPLRLTRPGKLLWTACVNRLLMIDAGAFYVPKWNTETRSWFWCWWLPQHCSFCKGGILKHLCWLSWS